MKNIVLIFSCFTITSIGIAQDKPAQDWFHKSSETQGINVDKAYAELLEGKTAEYIIVAVIDNGVDTKHEDLQSVMWINKDEIPNNGIDDDNNGYIDDIHGWNFIGGETEDVGVDNLEITRVYSLLHSKFENKDIATLSKKEKKEYDYYLEIKTEFDKRLAKATDDFSLVPRYKAFYAASKSTIAEILGKTDYNIEEVTAIDTKGDEALDGMKSLILHDLEHDFSKEIESMEEHYGLGVKYHYNTDFNTREIVGDNYFDLSEKNYGNNRVGALVPGHGTHVAGIIAADRTNGIGMKGIADHAKIMALRVVPDGDERDKDIANAIYYAVDNGAKIINMSFGKSYSPYKDAVDEAMIYASKKGVLLIHAAGNSNKLNTTTNNYPNQFIGEKKGKRITTWLEIGAEGWEDLEHLPTSFSNYGQKTVHIFAPGLDIYSTTPDNNYEYYNGTSMAAPVVAGVAALIWSYNPTLTAKQIKKIILKTGTDYGSQQVVIPGKDEKTKFKKLSCSGKVVNVYEALKLANKMGS